jgi:hypothetical protein
VTLAIFGVFLVTLGPKVQETLPTPGALWGIQNKTKMLRFDVEYWVELSGGSGHF